MEDPWANAWQEPEKPANDSQNTWNRSQDAETDIAAPSWATGAGVKWAEPSHTQESLWNSHLPVGEWNPSPYDTIAFGKASQTELSQPDRSPPSIAAGEISLPSLPSPAEDLKSLESTSFPDEHNPPIARSRSPTPVSTHSHPSVPGSPDAFGTFETGLDAGEVGVHPWGHSADLSVPASGADEWIPTWEEGKPKAEVQVDNEPTDEWDAAKQQKERQDRHVPPEVLNSILRQFEELANDLWPKHTEHNDTNLTDFHHGQETGIEKIETIIADQLIQDLILPQNMPFSKSVTSKHMNEALRLTRHLEVTRSSPMALYMASKGSTAWEASVKSRPEVLQDDVLPQGWRIIEKEEPTTATENKKKAGGRLLSLFGRRGPVPSSEVSPGLMEPSTRNTRTPPPGITSTGSPRVSADSAQPLPTGSVTPSTPAMLSTTSVTASSTRPPTPAPAPPPLPQTEVFQPIQPPSAVSRFLNRFSLNKSSGSNTRNSLALSSDDLEFLSDIVPSATEEEDEDTQLKRLTNMIASTPVSTKLPPPLAPPPRANALPTQSASSRSRSPILNSDPPPLIISTSRSEAPNVSPTQSASIIPSFSDTSMGSFSSSPLSRHAPASFKTSSRPGPTISSPPSRSQTPLSSKRTPVAIMSTSSVVPTGSTFNFPPPPPSTLPPVLPPPRNAVRASIPPLNPFSASRSPSPKSLAPTKPFASPNGSEFFDPYQPSAHVPAAFDTSISLSAFSDDNLIPASSSANTSYSSDLLDDFDEFVSSPLRSPSPPHIPTKPTSFGHKLSLSRQLTPLSLRSVSPDKPQPPLPPPKISRAADHQRTKSLVETAAARPGRWPAPPSPLPDVLPPPGASEPSFGSGLLAGSSSMQDQQTTATAGMGASVSSPAYFSLAASAVRPSTFPVPTLSPSSIQLRAVPQPKQQGISATSSRSLTSGGLSAQDLSFFEGL